MNKRNDHDKLYSKGDIVKTNSGKKAEVIDAWGVARYWYKLKTTDGEIIITMSDQIDSLIERYHSGKRRLK